MSVSKRSTANINLTNSLTEISNQCISSRELLIFCKKNFQDNQQNYTDLSKQYR